MQFSNFFPGSIPIFSVTKGKVRALFKDGHTCNENESYSTTVDFKCSQTDSGPIFISQDGCTTKLSWETPKACPTFAVNSENCKIYSHLGDLDLNGLFKADGFTKQFERTKNLVYNICGKLRSNCSTYPDVSACFTDGNTQRIIGWNKPHLSFTNGKIQLKYTGEKCANQNKPYSLTINLKCSFDEEPSSTVQRVDNCDFAAVIFTKSACLTPYTLKNCSIDNENDRYDLSPLVRRNGNYKIRDREHGEITYFLNLCNPVIPEENTILSAGSMVYMMNSSIPSITERCGP